jgi:erythromycin esterase
MKYSTIGLIIGLRAFSVAYCQSLTNEQVTFLKSSSRTVYVDSLQDQPDWSFLLPHVQDKNLILIGEFNHGSKEIFEWRNSLIMYLHQKTGTKTILFESGIGELVAADLNRASLTPFQMTDGLFGGWRTKEFVELMSYVKSHNISIAGLDVQRTGGTFNPVLKEVVKKYKLDTLSIYDLESRYSLAARELTNKKAIYDSLRIITEKLILDYQKVKNELITFITKDAPKDLLLVNITLENRIKYLSYMLEFLKDKDWNRRWAARDSAMANNAQWLIENVYKDGPVIIVAHNYHIGKYNENETVMGEVLAPGYRNDMYSIGIFAGSGSFNDNSGKVVEMVPPDSVGLDIKHIITQLNGEVTFLNIPSKFSNGSDWLNQEITINDTFIDLENSNKMVVAKTFDALILLKSVSPATVD